MERDRCFLLVVHALEAEETGMRRVGVSLANGCDVQYDGWEDELPTWMIDELVTHPRTHTQRKATRSAS